MKEVSRRMFLETMLIAGGAAGLAALGAGSVYANAAGISGLNSEVDLINQLRKGYKAKPKNKILADSHAHFAEIKDENALNKLLCTFSANADWQSISTILDNNPRLSYEKLSESINTYIPKQKRFSIEMKDEYATVLKDHELQKGLVFIRSQEVYAFNSEKISHEIHICLEGCNYLKNSQDVKRVIEYGLKNEVLVILNHPFAKPVKYIKYWFPDKKEKEFLKNLALDYKIVVEGHNMINSLWMAASNGSAKEFFSNASKDIPLIANTDSHPSDIETQKEQIGLAGTLFPKEDCDVKSLTGKEIIQKKKKLMLDNKFETLENYASPCLFYKAMVK